MPGDPDIAACTEVTSSGVDVPKPTSVSPMTRGETPSPVATWTAPRTSSSPPAISRKRPPINGSQISNIVSPVRYATNATYRQRVPADQGVQATPIGFGKLQGAT